MKPLVLFTILSACVLTGCKKDDDKIAPALLTNVDIESSTNTFTPDGWNAASEGGYKMSWTKEEAFSKTHSLKISIDTVDKDHFALWRQQASMIPYGQDIVLTAKVKTKNLTGDGAALAISGFSPSISQAVQFSTTQGTNKISGNTDWTTISVTINNVSESVKTLVVYGIMLQGTTGAVYFDDIKLTSHPR